MESEQPVEGAGSQSPVEQKPAAPEAQAGQPAARRDDRRGRGPGRGRFRRDDRRGRDDRGGDRGPGEQAPPPADDGGRRPTGNLRDAVRQIERIRGDLRRVLEEMNEVIKILDQAEREKTASDEEIAELRESVDEMQDGRSYSSRQQRNPPPQRPASRPAPKVEEEPERERESSEEQQGS